jgi:hypothetical protein
MPMLVGFRIKVAIQLPTKIGSRLRLARSGLNGSKESERSRGGWSGLLAWSTGLRFAVFTTAAAEMVCPTVADSFPVWTLSHLSGPVTVQPPSIVATFLRTQAVPDFVIQSATGKVGEAIPLTISLPRNLPDTYTFLMFRGLPEGFALSAGFHTKDHWILSLRDAVDVKLFPASSYQGLFALEILLVRGKDVAPDRRTITVEIQPTDSPMRDATGRLPRVDATPLTSPTVAQSAAPLPLLEPNDEDRAMLERADRLLHEGDIAAARLIWGRLARKGLAEAAIAMAKSYDPDFLSRIPHAGLKPDLGQARDWYRKAEELGSPEATSRLSTLQAAKP